MSSAGITGIDLTPRTRAVRHVEHCMGTVFSIDLRSAGGQPNALQVVIAWLHWVDDTFSTFKPDSQISRLARGEISLDDCAPEVREVLARCAELEAETGGYFTAQTDRGLDPTGLVKGWAIERASEVLVAHGSTRHCVNGGGDVQCVGSAGPGKPWRIGIADPLRPGHLVGVVAGTDIAVATSGSAERGSHIVDPHTGDRPTALAGVTVVGARLATADAYATAAFAMGAAAPRWIESLAGYEGLVVYADGTQWPSPGFAGSAPSP